MDQGIEMTLQELITDLKAAGANENTLRLAMNCYELGQKDEREACAKIADKWFLGWPHPSGVIAEEIRQRGEA